MSPAHGDGSRLPAGTSSKGSPATRFDVEIAQIIHVDEINNSVDIQYLTKTGGNTGVKVSFPGAGIRHFTGDMPQIGDVAVVLQLRLMQRATYPIIIGWIPNGWSSALGFDVVQPLGASRASLPEGAEFNISGWDDVNRYRVRHVYPGDHLSSSAEGSELYLDRSAYMANRSLNEFTLRDADQTAMLRALSQFTALTSGRYKRGLVERSAMLFEEDVLVVDSSGVVPEAYAPGDYSYEYQGHQDFKGAGAEGIGTVATYLGRSPLIAAGLLDSTGKPYNLINNAVRFPFVVHPDGARRHYVTESNVNPNDVAPGAPEFFVEDRLEMPHMSDGVLDVNREMDGFDVDSPSLFIERVYGTIIGNDPYTAAGRVQYGKVLRPVIFSSPQDGPGSAKPRMEECAPENYSSLAACYLFRMRPPKLVAQGITGSQLMISYDKDGVMYANLPASSSDNPMGPGWSGFVNCEGGLKMTLGKNAIGQSLHILCAGSVVISPGSGKGSPEGSSLHLDLRSAFHLESRGAQEGGVSWFRRAWGDSVDIVRGDETRDTIGGRYDKVGGAIRQECGRKSVHAEGGYSLKSGGDVNEVVVGFRKMTIAAGTYGGGFDRSIVGLPGMDADKETILVGGKSSLLMLGDHKNTVLLGNRSETVVTGGMSSRVVAGNFTAETLAGMVVVRTAAGALQLESAAGTAMLFSSGPLTMQSGSSAAVLAPLVSLGVAPVGGVVTGVPGPAGPHIDYITGLPVRGSPFVSSS